MKALIVDDSKVMCQILKRHLNVIEVDADLAHDGRQALDNLNSQSYEIILIDWNMPVLNGIETIIELRDQGIKTPVIMITTESEDARKKTAFNAGANDYITKPFTADTIQQKVLKNLKQ